MHQKMYLFFPIPKFSTLLLLLDFLFEIFFLFHFQSKIKSCKGPYPKKSLLSLNKIERPENKLGDSKSVTLHISVHIFFFSNPFALLQPY